MSAREQAREAVANNWLIQDADSLVTDEMADVASDVWEPLLRNLIEAIRASANPDAWNGGKPLMPGQPLRLALDRAEEALGD
jgi:hypothetical protein